MGLALTHHDTEPCPASSAPRWPPCKMRPKGSLLALTLWDSTWRGASTGPYRGPAPTPPRPPGPGFTYSRACPLAAVLGTGLWDGQRTRCLEDDEGEVSAGVPATCRSAGEGSHWGSEGNRKPREKSGRRTRGSTASAASPVGTAPSSVKRRPGTPSSSAGGRVLGEGRRPEIPAP